MTGRDELEGNIRRPSDEEALRLRNVIERCMSIRAEFDLMDTTGLTDNDVWGTGTVMQLAVELDDVSLLDQLATEGHSVDGLPNSLGISTLYVATYRESKNAFSWLLEKGVDFNFADVDGVTPLMMASMRPQDRLSSIQALIKAGARIDAVDLEGRSALVYAIRSKNYENARLLADAGADISVSREYLATELSDAKNEMHANYVREALNFIDENFRTSDIE